MKSDPEFKATLDELSSLGVACGLHTEREKRLLWRLSKQTQEGAIVEIGSYEGYSTILLAKAARADSKIFAIDPHTGKMCESDESQITAKRDSWQMFNKNVNRTGVSEKMKALKLRSEEVAKDWKTPIGLLFIDGSHREQDVQNDLMLWRENLLTGSIIIFHDLWVIGVRRVIQKYILTDYAFGNFRYAPCCMFAVTYFGNKHHSQIFERNLWRLILFLRGMIEGKMTLRRYLHAIIRKVSI